jgi:Trypsin-co-occurring domain 2
MMVWPCRRVVQEVSLVGDPKPIGLAEAIGRVRAELEDARVRGAGQELQFRLDKVTLEFAVELEREGGAEAGIKIWVVSVGAKGGVSSTHTNTVTVSMVPQVKSGAEWVDAMVSAEATGGRPRLPGSSSGATGG